MLMQTLITIECGPKLETKLTLHEELLCCHSKQLAGQFAKAKSARIQFAKADKFREKLAAYVYPETTQKEFEDGRLEQQVSPVSRTWKYTTEPMFSALYQMHISNQIQLTHSRSSL
jgi:hypothetical protein